MSDALNQWNQVLMNNYGTPPVELVSGRGATVIDAQGRAPHRLAHVAADPGMARALHASHQPQPVAALRQPDQRLPHPARRAGHHQAGKIPHAAPPLLSLSLAASRRAEKPGVAGRPERA